MALNFPAGAAISGLLLIALLSAPASAHNITRILSNNPDFSSFNSLLSSTDLAAEINSRRTITVLAVSNDAVGNITGFSPDVQRRILSVHVILDYFDLDKLQNLNKHSTILTTLFQASGLAEGLAGFLNVTKFGDGRVVFGSAAPGAGVDADLVGSVAARPYNISVLQVSSVIIPPGIAGVGDKSPPPTPAAANAPASAKVNETAPSKAPTPAADTPVTEAASPAPSADVPVDAPAPADAPAADTPVADAPAEAPEADSPVSDSPNGEADEETINSGGERVVIGAGLGVIVGAVLLASL